MKCIFSIFSNPRGTPSHDHHRLPHYHVTMSQMASYVGNTGPLSVCVDANNWNSYVGHQPPLTTHHQPPTITSPNSTPRSPGTREASCQTAARTLTTVSRSLVSTLRPTGRCVVNKASAIPTTLTQRPPLSLLRSATLGAQVSASRATSASSTARTPARSTAMRPTRPSSRSKPGVWHVCIPTSFKGHHGACFYGPTNAPLAVLKGGFCSFPQWAQWAL